MKTCSKCGESQELTEFAIKNPRTGTRTAWCKTCNRAYQKGHYVRNRDVYRTKARAYEEANGGVLGKRLRNYKITEETFQDLLGRHEGMCWICLGREATKIDHDHSCCPGASSCGKCVRGVLCGQCNSGLGMLGDSPESLRRALDYLAQ